MLPSTKIFIVIVAQKIITVVSDFDKYAIITSGGNLNVNRNFTISS